jgi:putative membrane protein
MTKYHYFLIALFVIAWTLSAINPTTPENWLLENVVVFLWIPAIIIFGRYFRLSNLSYTIITIFAILHLVGAHYDYGSVPIGEVLGDWTGSERNQYDRLMHLLSGLLMIYPVREFFLRATNIKGFWSYFFPVNIILSLSALYEIYEWVSTVHLSPEMSYLFVGGNDPWDAVKDMALALLGAVVTTTLLACARIFRNQRSND